MADKTAQERTYLFIDHRHLAAIQERKTKDPKLTDETNVLMPHVPTIYQTPTSKDNINCTCGKESICNDIKY